MKKTQHTDKSVYYILKKFYRVEKRKDTSFINTVYLRRKDLISEKFNTVERILNYCFENNFKKS